MHGEVAREVGLIRFGEARPADDAGVVDQDVDTAPLLDRSIDERLRASGGGHVAGVGDRLSARVDDLGGDPRRRLRVRADARHRAADVVDDDAGAQLGEQARVGPADAASRAGDNRDPALEAVLAQTATGASKPRRLPSVPPTMALRSSSGTPAISVVSSSWLPRKVPSAWG